MHNIKQRCLPGSTPKQKWQNTSVEYIYDKTVIMFAMAATMVAVIVNTEEYNTFMKGETTQDLGSFEWHFVGA